MKMLVNSVLLYSHLWDTFVHSQPSNQKPQTMTSVLSQDERGFNEFSFDELEKNLAKEEAALAAGEGEENEEEADMFG